MQVKVHKRARLTHPHHMSAVHVPALPAADTTPSVIVPTIPGLVTNPTGPTSNTSAPGTPIPFVPPLTGDASASNNTSNSTLQGGTTNSSVLIYTSWVRAYGSAPAYCDVWNGTAFVKSESLGNGFREYCRATAGLHVGRRAGHVAGRHVKHCCWLGARMQAAHSLQRQSSDLGYLLRHHKLGCLLHGSGRAL